MTHTTRVYISGPMTGVDGYEKNFKEAEMSLHNLGYKVFNPAMFNGTLPEIEYDEYMQIDYALLDMCDAIFLLDGWENSNGAKLELQRALSRGMTIMIQSNIKKYISEIASKLNCKIYTFE